MTFSISDNVAIEFSKLCQELPHRPAVIFQEGEYDFRELRDLAAVFAIKFSQNGVDKTSVLTLRNNDLGIVLASTLASALLGAKLVVGMSAHVQQDSANITHEIVVEIPSATLPNQILIDQSFSPAYFSDAEKEEMWNSVQCDPNREWLVSGPSGAVDSAGAVNQRDVLKMVEAFQRVHDTAKTRVASFLPHASGNFITFALSALLNGMAIVGKGTWSFWEESNVSIVQTASSYVPTIIEHGNQSPKIAKVVIVGSPIPPVFAQALLGSFEEISADVSNVISTPKTANRPGQNLELINVETVINSINGIESSVALYSPKPGTNRIIALVVFEENVNRLQLFELSKHLCQEQLGSEFVPFKMRPVDKFPLRSNGTIDRELCARLLLNVVGQHTTD